MSSIDAIAEKLFFTNAIHLNPQKPYKWASGIISPIYCDNRILLSHPLHRDYIQSELANEVMEHFPDADCVAGVATAGIAWGVLVANQIKNPFIYVRNDKKKHGLGKQIEGKVTPNNKVVVVEDLISTGGSAIGVVHILKEHNIQVEGVISIFNYGFKNTEKAFEKHNIPFRSLLNYNELMSYAERKKLFTIKELDKMKQWITNPSSWKH